jgi:beta-galactosidase
VTVPIELDLPDAAGGSSATEAIQWVDVLTPTTARPVGFYRAEYYAGRAAATLNDHGQGQVLYAGTLGDEALHETLVRWATATAGIEPTLHAPEGVEATERWQGGNRFLFLLNHSDQVQEVLLPELYLDLLSGEELQGTVGMEAKSALVLQPHSTGS